jgi:hypothetical protein
MPERPLCAVELRQLGEEEALTDGLIIGYFLTRDLYQDRIDGLEDHIDKLTDDRDWWLEAATAGDDLDDELDHAEFDALGGFGVEPWAGDWFGHDDEH